MSKEMQEFLEGIKQPEPTIGAIEAAVEGVSAFLSQMKEMGGQVWDAGKPMFDHGRTEAAAALFSPHGSGFVMYGGNDGKQEQDAAPDHGLPAIEAVKQPEVQQEQSRGGMEM